jgi:glucose-6-phosphate isomerase
VAPLTANSLLAETPAWTALEVHAADVRGLRLRDLFARDPARGVDFTAETDGLYLDYSKNRLTHDTIRLLVALAERAGLRLRIEAMFGGQKINVTEQRAVLHVALRAPEGQIMQVDGVDVVPEVHRVRRKMAAFANAVRSGEWKGHTGKPIRNVVNIGIGGSDLGPHMAYEALKDYSDRSRTFRYVSNVDATQLWEALHGLEPAETLFVVCSKTFTTLETLANATSARAWVVEKLGDRGAVQRHIVAVASNAKEVQKFGIDAGKHVRDVGLGRGALLGGLCGRTIADDRDWP